MTPEAAFTIVCPLCGTAVRNQCLEVGEPLMVQCWSCDRFYSVKAEQIASLNQEKRRFRVSYECER